METRKLQRVGGGTFTVSIPKSWAEDHGLKAGSTIHLYTHRDGSIIVRGSVKDGDALSSCSIRIEGTDPSLLTRSLSAAHIVGFDTVVLVPASAFSSEQCQAARDLVQDLVGATIITETQENITVKNLLSPSDVSLRQSVVQLHFVVLSIHREATVAFIDADSGAHERISERSSEATRLFKMVARHFNRALISLKEVDRLGTNRPEIFDYYTTARELERIARQSESIARQASRLTEEISETERALFEEAAELARGVIEDAGTIVLDPSGNMTAHAVMDECDTVSGTIGARERSISRDSAGPEVIRALSELGKTVDNASMIAEVAVQQELRNKHI